MFGCAVATMSPDATRPDDVSLEVKNSYMSGAVTVYVQSSTRRQRIGVVELGQDATLALPYEFLGQRIAFVLVPSGRRGTRVYTTSDMPPAYGSYSFAVRDVPFPVGTSEVTLFLAPRLKDSQVRGWR